MSPALDAIRPKIAKLIPLLSSDKSGEVAATVAAIGRTLKAGGCDWHALAAFIGDVPVPIYAQSRPAAAKPQRPPSPWPTYTTLRHSERVAWLDAVERCPLSMEKNTRGVFEELRKKIVCRPHELLSRKEINLFTRLVRTTWILGVRP